MSGSILTLPRMTTAAHPPQTICRSTCAGGPAQPVGRPHARQHGQEHGFKAAETHQTSAMTWHVCRGVHGTTCGERQLAQQWMKGALTPGA